MNNKQLAEMVKILRKKKLAEVIGKPGPFDPSHRTTHKEDPTSSNQYFHSKKAVEEGMQHSTLGPDRSRKMNVYSSTKGALEKRRWGGNQSMNKRYASESATSEEDLGTTDTGKKGKEAETVTVNPKDNTASAKGSMNKNTTIKELKEK
jgi:hypothetical protein